MLAGYANVSIQAAVIGGYRPITATRHIMSCLTRSTFRWLKVFTRAVFSSDTNDRNEL